MPVAFGGARCGSTPANDPDFATPCDQTYVTCHQRPRTSIELNTVVFPQDPPHCGDERQRRCLPEDGVMPGGDICTVNMGTPWPIAYGYFRATGMQKISYSVPAAPVTGGGLQPADMQIGAWDLGEGELDGCNALWINDVLQFAYDQNGNLMGQTLLGVMPSTSEETDPTDNISNTPTLTSFSFTRLRCPADGVPVAASQLSSWNRSRARADREFDHSVVLVAPHLITRSPGRPRRMTTRPCRRLGDFRGMRCRMFDGSFGHQTDYRFTTNPIWHFVDLWLRRAIKPEYAIPQNQWPDTLTASERKIQLGIDLRCRAVLRSAAGERVAALFGQLRLCERIDAGGDARASAAVLPRLLNMNMPARSTSSSISRALPRFWLRRTPRERSRRS
jgi:hypothetical protein